MSIDKIQSAIKEVEDQISLDYAEGEFLNVVTGNLGLERPVFGFSDDVWRALAKSIALQFKQIHFRFYDVMSILFGPQITQGGTFAGTTVQVGVVEAFLSDTSGFPQVGTMVLDEGLASEETIEYCLIDRFENKVFFNSPTTQAHLTLGQDAESALLSNVSAGDTEVLLTDAGDFDFAVFPVTLVLGRGTAEEEVVELQGVDLDANKITISAAANNHLGYVPSIILSPLQNDASTHSNSLAVTDASHFPEEGVVLTGPSSAAFTATAGTATSVSVAASTFTVDRLVGYRVVFSGNVTAALAGVEAVITDNTDQLLTLRSTLPASPVVGDEFTLRGLLRYNDVDYEENLLFLQGPIPDDLVFSTGSIIEFMKSNATALAAPVQVKGTGWDVYQSESGKVQLYFPEGLEDETNILSASYLHTILQNPTPTNLTSAASVGDQEIDVASIAGFPIVGVALIDGSERIGYYHDGTTNKLFFPGTLQNNYVGTESVDLYEPTHVGDLLTGDFISVADVFPGPYVYNILERAITPESTGQTTLNQFLAAPATIAQEQIVTNSAIEVDSAAFFPVIGFPYSVRLGQGTGNLEEININDISFRSRTYTTVATGSSIGDTEIEVAALAGPGASGNKTFLNKKGYRVRIGRGTANDEVVWCLGTDTGPNKLLIEAAVNVHSIGEKVELMSDVLSCSTALSDDHLGVNPYGSRKSLGVADSAERFAVAETAAILYREVDVVNASGFPTVNDYLYLNFGKGIVNFQTELTADSNAGATTFTVADDSGLPVSGDFVFSVAMDQGGFEHYVGSVTGANTLTVADAVRADHATGSKVVFDVGEPEFFLYNTLVSNAVGIANGVVLNYNHQLAESAIPASAESVPGVDGKDYPLTMPVDLEFRVSLIFDYIRAAGVEVEFIYSR